MTPRNELAANGLYLAGVIASGCDHRTLIPLAESASWACKDCGAELPIDVWRTIGRGQ